MVGKAPQSDRIREPLNSGTINLGGLGFYRCELFLAPRQSAAPGPHDQTASGAVDLDLICEVVFEKFSKTVTADGQESRCWARRKTTGCPNRKTLASISAAEAAGRQVPLDFLLDMDCVG